RRCCAKERGTLCAACSCSIWASLARFSSVDKSAQFLTCTLIQLWTDVPAAARLYWHCRNSIGLSLHSRLFSPKQSAHKHSLLAFIVAAVAPQRMTSYAAFSASGPLQRWDGLIRGL